MKKKSCCNNKFRIEKAFLTFQNRLLPSSVLSKLTVWPILGVVNGPFKNTGLGKFLWNFSGLAVSIFAQMSASQSLEFLQGSYMCSDYRSQSHILKGKKTLGLTKKNASLAVSLSLAFTICHPSYWDQYSTLFFWESNNIKKMFLLPIE